MFTIQISGLNESLRAISHIPGGVEKAGERAIKKTFKVAKEQADTSFNTTYTYRKRLSSVAKSEQVRGLRGSLGYGSAETFLDEFNYQPQSPLNGKRGQFIKSEIKRGINEIKSYKAFKTRRKKPLFERIGKRRYPIRRAKGPSVGSLIADNSVSRPVIRTIENNLPAFLSAEAAKLLGG